MKTFWGGEIPLPLASAISCGLTLGEQLEPVRVGGVPPPPVPPPPELEHGVVPEVTQTLSNAGPVALPEALKLANCSVVVLLLAVNVKIWPRAQPMFVALVVPELKL